jgi:ADP-heptose:LPS heptosyltransferase
VNAIPPPAPIKDESVPARTRILIVRTGALGDTILAVPLIESLALRHPGAEITVLGTRAYAILWPPQYLFQGADSLDWTWLFADDHTLPQAQPTAYDLAYLVLKKPEAVIANLSRAGTREAKWVSSVPPAGMHMVEHLHQGLGLKTPPRAPCLIHLNRGQKRDLIWLHPGSGGPAKCAPLDFFLALARQLQSATGWEVVVTAGEDDGFLLEQEPWEELIHLPRVTVMEHQPLSVLGERLGGARLFVGNDSGISHLAAGFGIPAAVCFVTTDPVQWAPWVPAQQLRIVDLRKEPITPQRLQELSSALLALASKA